MALTGQGHEGKTYELAGDEFYTLTDLAAEITAQSGKDIPYRNIPEADYAAALKMQACLMDLLRRLRHGIRVPLRTRCLMTAMFCQN